MNNQREHLILLLSNSQSAFGPPSRGSEVCFCFPHRNCLRNFKLIYLDIITSISRSDCIAANSPWVTNLSPCLLPTGEIFYLKYSTAGLLSIPFCLLRCAVQVDGDAVKRCYDRLLDNYNKWCQYLRITAVTERYAGHCRFMLFTKVRPSQNMAS